MSPYGVGRRCADWAGVGMKNSRAQAIPARVKANARRRSRLRDRRWSSVIGCIWVFVAVVAVADITLAMLPQPAPDPETTSEFATSHSGRILAETRSEQCELGTFNNDTGRISNESRHCENAVVLDSRGDPVPLTTIHRLDAIRKSFSNENR
jgi:hypothetical protein